MPEFHEMLRLNIIGLERGTDKFRPRQVPGQGSSSPILPLLALRGARYIAPAARQPSTPFSISGDVG